MTSAGTVLGCGLALVPLVDAGADAPDLLEDEPPPHPAKARAAAARASAQACLLTGRQGSEYPSPITVSAKGSLV